MTRMLLLLLATAALSACQKPDGIQPSSLPEGLQGYWSRGSFDLRTFWNYPGTEVQPPAATDGLILHPAGVAELFSVNFPADPQEGCSPQKLLFRIGDIRFNEGAKTFTLTFRSGYYRELYQNCPSKTNIDRALALEDLEEKTLTGYWKLQQSAGKTLLGIAYAAPEGPYLYLEQSATPW